MHKLIGEEIKKALLEKIFSKIYVKNDCWEYTGKRSKKKHNYGKLKFKQKEWQAHRLIYLAKHGEIPVGKCVCHTCDNPPCVNPDHLFLGEHRVNVNDMISKRRAFWQRDPKTDDEFIGGFGSKLRHKDYELLFWLRDVAKLTNRQIGMIFEYKVDDVREIYNGKRFKHFFVKDTI